MTPVLLALQAAGKPPSPMPYVVTFTSAVLLTAAGLRDLFDAWKNTHSTGVPWFAVASALIGMLFAGAAIVQALEARKAHVENSLLSHAILTIEAVIEEQRNLRARYGRLPAKP